MKLMKIFLIFVFLFALTGIANAQYYDYRSFTGNIALASAGKGLTSWTTDSYGNPIRGANYSSGTISNFNINGTPLWANLIWQGYVDQSLPDNSGNANVTFNGYSVTGTPLKEVPGERGYGFSADVTQYMLSGTHNYTIGNVYFPGTDTQYNGFGLDVVYANSSLPYAQIQTIYQNDRAYWRQDCGSACTGVMHPQPTESAYSNRQTKPLIFNFDPVNYTRTATLTIQVAGAEEPTLRYPNTGTKNGVPYGPRSSIFWYQSGAGTTPTWLMDHESSGAQKLADKYLLHSAEGAEWDTLSLQFTILPGQTWYAAQIESDDRNYYGQSLSWVSGSFYLPINCPPPPPPTIPEPATMSLWGIGLGLAALKRKFFHKG